MGQIHVLDLSIANLIAAGEVVERPASAVKELVENAIDAGSTAITVEIQKGGIAQIRVSDNGCGMSAEDAVMAIRRHATSKIREAKDLDSILTLGFRGEALAAITAVSEFRLLTKRRDAAEGTLLSGSYGTVTACESAGCPDGTTVICERLFATTPARLKFLKTDSAEGTAVAQAMEKLAVSHPEIAFRMISDGHLKFSTSGDGSLQNAIYSVFGGAFAGRLIELSAEGASPIAVSGFLSEPDGARKSRSMQHFFVNGRSVRSKTLSSALEAAYRSYIPSDSFPACVLNLTVPAGFVDVNIHPAKMEVKFSDEKAVFDAAYSAVRGVLARKVSRPTLILPEAPCAPAQEAPAQTPLWSGNEETLHALFAKAVSRGAASEADAPKRVQMEMPKMSEAEEEPPVDVPPIRRFQAPVSPKLGAETSLDGFSARARLYGDAIHTVERAQTPKKETPVIPESTDAQIAGATAHDVPPYRLIGEAFAGYILAETEGKLLIIDKHAAHERINFERLRASMTSDHPATQMLLITETVPLSEAEREACLAYRTQLESVGFALTVGEREAVLSGIPQDFSRAEALRLFAALLAGISESQESFETRAHDFFERALYQSACKASVKAGRLYDEAHLRWICDNVLRYDCVRYCPHGRPVAFEISKKELDSRFGRT